MGDGCGVIERGNAGHKDAPDFVLKVRGGYGVLLHGLSLHGARVGILMWILLQL